MDSKRTVVTALLSGKRPLPWHNVPKCQKSDAEYAGVSAQLGTCGGPIVDLSENGGGYACGACGAAFHPSADERAQLQRAESAWSLVLEGKVHEDRACARCGGVLPIEQFRLCAPCVERDSAERQKRLF